jgi:DMSO/TMAO reductase YedYZ molybdopterin-dependent catalytic subunit
MDDPENKSSDLPEQEAEPAHDSSEPSRVVEPAAAVAAAPAKKAVEEAPPVKSGPTPLSERGYKDLNRREVLKLTPLVLLGAFAVPKFQDKLLQGGVALSDWASNAYFSKARLARTFKDSDVVPFDKFPYNGYDVIDPEVDLESWTLTVEGLVKNPGEFEIANIQGLPKIVQNTRHVCVEGWDAIGNFGGARVSDFLQVIGADTTAKYVEVECADDYYESIDMASMLQPQSLLCYEMYGKPLDRGHGAPVRLQLPTKLGYKQAKYLTTLRVTNVLTPGKRGYWEDQGYAWFGGL